MSFEKIQERNAQDSHSFDASTMPGIFPPAFQLKAESEEEKKRGPTTRSEKVDNEKGAVGTYTAQPGETFSQIAKKFSTTETKLLKINGLQKTEDGKLVLASDVTKEVKITKEGMLAKGDKEPAFIRVPNSDELNFGIGDAGKYEYTKIEGEAFIQGDSDRASVDFDDVDQNLLGDCYLMAGMAAVARANPSAIENLISKNDDGTYDVTLYIKDEQSGKRIPKIIKVTSEFPTTKGKTKPKYAGVGDVSKKEDGTIDKKELWPMLLEKAFAVYNYGYDAIESGSSGKAMELFTGSSKKYFKVSDMDEKDILSKLSTALSVPMAITASSKDELKLDGSNSWTKEGIVPNHAYVVMGVDETAKTISLYNPWGRRHVGKEGDVGGNKSDFSSISMAAFKAQFDGVHILKP